jgi:AcrR family transcriptional regulator
MTRSDARRNRTRVLSAAAAVFAAQGVGASTEEVARAAGVGVGTVFRHFPTKEALLLAVYEERLDELAGEARSLAAADDPGAAFEDFFRTVVASSGTKLAVVDALAAVGVDVRASGQQHGLGAALHGLLTRAQQAGRRRPARHHDAARGDVAGGAVRADRRRPPPSRRGCPQWTEDQ